MTGRFEYYQLKCQNSIFNKYGVLLPFLNSQNILSSSVTIKQWNDLILKIQYWRWKNNFISNVIYRRLIVTPLSMQKGSVTFKTNFTWWNVVKIISILCIINFLLILLRYCIIMFACFKKLGRSKVKYKHDVGTSPVKLKVW